MFLLTAGLGVALLLVPMKVTVPWAGPVGLLVALAVFALALLSGGTVGRVEGGALLLVALSLMVWLYRRSPAFAAGAAAETMAAPTSRLRAVALLLLGVTAMIVGADLVVRGVGSLIATAGFSATA